MAAMIKGLGKRRRHLKSFEPQELSAVEAEMVDRQLLDPEEPAEMFRIGPAGRGLTPRRPGCVCGRADCRRLRGRHRQLVR